MKCKNNLFKPCVWSKQPSTIKTIICNDIFTSLRRKKVQSPAKQLKKIVQSVSKLLSMKWNRLFRGLTMSACNFGVGSLEHFSKPTTKKQCFLHRFRAIFQLRWRRKTYLKRRPLFRSQIFKFLDFVSTSKARI